MSPVFSHGSLRLYLLALLDDGPKHGYEIIQELSDKFGGTYKPSAGTVYPRLAKLGQEGLVSTEQSGRRTVYRITDAGREELAERPDDLAGVEQEIAESVKRMADNIRTDISATMRSMRADMAAAAQSAKGNARASRQRDSRSGRAPNGPADGATGRPEDGRDDDRLSEAEAELTLFRSDVRTELRAHAAREGLDDLTVETIRTVLAQAKVSITDTLGR